MNQQIRRVKYRRVGRWGENGIFVDVVGLFWVQFTKDGIPFYATAVNLYELEPADAALPELIQEALDLPIVESNYFFDEPWEYHNSVTIVFKV